MDKKEIYKILDVFVEKNGLKTVLTCQFPDRFFIKNIKNFIRTIFTQIFSQTTLLYLKYFRFEENPLKNKKVMVRQVIALTGQDSFQTVFVIKNIKKNYIFFLLEYFYKLYYHI